VAVSYLTSNTLIESIKNRALIPTTQQTFTPEDFLRFANEEMMMGVVPLVEQFHEEFFIFEEATAVNTNQISYEIPYRATGNKLRSVYVLDAQQNRFPLTRVSSDDLEYYQGNGYGQSIFGFYIANNTVNLLNVASQDSNTKLLFSYYMRPNKLVSETRVVKVQSVAPSSGIALSTPSAFVVGTNQVTVPSHNLIDGVSGTFTLSGFATLPYPFNTTTKYYVKVINASLLELYSDEDLTQPVVMQNIWSTTDADVNVANDTIKLASGLYSNSIPDSTAVEFTTGGTLPSPLNVAPFPYFTKRVGTDTYELYTDQALTFKVDLTTQGSGLFSVTQQVIPGTGSFVPDTYDINLQSTIPSAFNINELFDVIQANSPHKTLRYDLEPVYVSGTIIRFRKQDMRRSIDDRAATPVYVLPKKGDYVTLAGETIIPQIPDELHSMLAQRVACRCLEALGDREGLAAANAKLVEMETKTATLINDRVEGSPQKVVNHNSPLRQRFIGSKISRS
jgi:hypothetical protein